MTLKAGSILLFVVVTLALTGCASSTGVFREQNMDFASIRTVAILPLANLSRDTAAADRVRDVFAATLLASGGIYVLPAGEVARGINRVGIANPTAPSTEEILKLGGVVKADAVITGVLREYGEVRSGSATANVISVSMQMVETQTGRVVWSAATTKGGIGVSERMFGGGGEPLNDVTEKAVNDLINKLF
jgi:hypothetical protein